jgi:hypothetical protein
MGDLDKLSNNKAPKPSKNSDAAKKQSAAKKSNTKYTVLGVIFILKLLSMIFAWYIAWNCFVSDLKMIRVFKTMLCMGFSEFYIFYFFVTSVLLDMPCR